MMWSPSAVLFHTRSSWDLVHGKKFAFYILPIHDHTMSRNAELDTIQKQLLDDSDYYRMVDDEYGKEFQALGNSGCQKLAAELDYTHRIEKENCVERDSYTRYEFTVSILDSGNRVLAQDVGSCDTQERPTSSLHNIRAMAKTRAWQRALKTAACVNDRLVSDLGPTERAADAQPRAAPQPAPQPAPQANSNGSKPSGSKPNGSKPNGQECACAIGDVTEPRLANGVYVCGTCSKPIQKAKRIQFLSARS